MADEAETTTKIKIERDNATVLRFNNEVPIAVNGSIARVPIGKEVEVGEHITDALTNAGISFTVVAPKGEAGSSVEGVSSGEPIISGTPDGAPSGEDPHPAGLTAAALTEVPTLSNDAPTTDVTISGTTPVGANEDGNYVLANSAVSAAGTVGETVDDNAGQEPGTLDGTIPDITKTIADITDAAEIDKLIAAEKAGKSRSGALSALEARKTELAA